ncbi:MAG TPA: elongation factor P hydroxylase [Pseudomonadales bacterium]|nr:elongation factor P hydroxylase [Pseudomonadales bacterium]HNI37928.1 elongation factor P hydroxylase [Pseudomonadales bacterium]HNL91927.1 elongation factor P hydroxylase [Pseudomonadales bacterium]HNN87008.1 elongation factor P hydroxylase [Pseudomonadales bacterium]
MSLPTAADIEQVFNALFAAPLNTVLIGGAPEPFYRPADDEDARHRIFYREDFVSSSLHEVAHWMVAGEARRLLPDWGYWYAPDGRDAVQQQIFEQMEVKPQALEWLLHAACGLRFRVSLDNLSEGAGDGSAFKDRVYEQTCHYIRNGVHERMQSFYQALAVTFSGASALHDLVLSRTALDGFY